MKNSPLLVTALLLAVAVIAVETTLLWVRRPTASPAPPASGSATAVAGQPPGHGATRGIEGDWTAAVRLETGELFVFERFHFSTHDGQVILATANERNRPIGGFEGAYRGDEFAVRLRLVSADADRADVLIEFDGRVVGDDRAEGAVTYHDAYRRSFHGTFAFARYGLRVTAPPPSPPPGPGVSAINGTWQGEYQDSPNGSRVPLYLELRQQGAQVTGTGRVGEEKDVSVTGLVAGSACTLELREPQERVEIVGEVTASRLAGRARVYSGPPDRERYRTFGTATLAR